VSAPFPYAPREKVAANLRRALGTADAEHAVGAAYEDAYRCLRAAAVNAICDLSAADIGSWEQLHAELD